MGRRAHSASLMRVGFAWACLLCAATVALPAFAQSEERPLSQAVSVTSVDPCMPIEPLLLRIAHWLRHERLDPRIAVRVFDQADRLSFEVLFQGRSVADRTFDVLPRDCVARRDAIALAVSLAIDNVVQRREEIAAQIAAEPVATPPSTTDAASTELIAATESTTPDAVPEPVPGAARQQLELGLAVGAAAAAHVLPGFAALGEAAVEVSSAPIMGRIGVVAATAGSVALEEGRLASYLLGGRADLCLVHPMSSVALIGCGGMQAGAVRMVGSGYTQSSASVQLWVTTAVRLALEWPRDSLRGRLWLEGIVPLVAPAARVVDADGATLGKLTTVRAGVILGVEALIVFR